MRYLTLLAILVATLPGRTVFAAPKPAAIDTVQEAVIVSKQAKAYFDRGEFAMAAELYRRAYEIDRARLEYLYGIGRSEQKQGHLKEALAAFEQLLALLPTTNPLQPKAKGLVEEIRRQLESTPALQPPKPEPKSDPTPVGPLPVVATPATASPTVQVQAPVHTGNSRATLRMIGWLGGGAGLLTAAGLAVKAGMDASQLADDKGKITGDAARDRQGAVNDLSTASAICGGVGLAGLALAWWNLGDAKVASDGRQVWVAWRF